MDVVAEVVEDILNHHGVKGMRWGIRKEKTEAQKDSHWLNKGLTPTLEERMPHKRLNERVAREAGRKMRSEVKALNKSPEFSTREAKRAIRKEHFSKGYLNGEAKSPIANKYNKAVSDIYMKHVKSEAAKRLEVSPSGKWEDRLVVGKGYWSITLKRVDGAQHAAIGNPELTFRVRPVLDDEGYIVDVEMVEDTVTQSSLFVDDMLEHHGVKGMRWGHRKAAGAQAVVVTDKKRSLKTTGGQGHPAHPDAVQAKTLGQVAKRSGHKALSNQELQDYAKRLNLEQNVKRLELGNKSAAQQFVAGLLGTGGKGGGGGGGSLESAAGSITAKKVAGILAKT